MIAFVKGVVFKKNEKEKDSSIIIDVNNIGYEVFVPQRIVSKYRVGDEILLYTFQRVAENINDLYGMETPEELAFFETVLSVSGIGPKSALLMSEMSFVEIEKAIEEENIAFLTKVPGIGKKTASRMILELKGKLPKFSVEYNTGDDSVLVSEAKQYKDVKAVLTTLGFVKRDIDVLFEQSEFLLEIEGLSDESIVKIALQKL